MKPAPLHANTARDRIICGRFLAGDREGFLATDYGLTVDEVIAILRAGLCHRPAAKRKGKRRTNR